MENFKLDDRVKIIGKNLSGKVAFIGETHFSEGEWLGIILDEAKGRNNGSIDGQQYFKCPRNYGLFVRSCQLQKEDDQNESNMGSDAKKGLYPNYLANSVSVKNKSEEKIKIDRKHKVKSLTRQIHPMNTVIEDLRNSLKYKSEEVFNLEKQKKESDDKLKAMKTEMQKLYDELKKRVRKDSDSKLEIETTKNDLMILKRKLHKIQACLQSSEYKRRKLGVTVDGLREITEHAIIEKEIAEERNEQLELLLKDETDKCKTLEIELDTIKEEMKIQSVNGVSSVHYVRKIENENEILKCALFRLRDLYKNLDHKFLTSKKDVEKYSKEIGDLKKAEKAMEDTFCKYQQETSELYDVIDSMLDTDDLVFEITDRNLKSEEKINDLYQALIDTEDQLEVSEEIEETLQEMRIMCRDEIECLETKIRHMEASSAQKAILIKEREDTINKYRELTFTLQERNRKLAQDLEAINRDRKEAVLAAENLKLKLQREKRNVAKDLIEKEKMMYEFESNTGELKYWLPFMPDTFFEQGGENAAIQVKLIASKMLKKLNLFTKLLHSLCYEVIESSELKNLALNTELLTYVYELYGCINLFIKSSDRINPEMFLTLSKHHESLEKESKELDSYITSLANDDIDKKYCINNIKNMCCSLSELLNTEYATDDERTMIYLTCYLNMIQSNCKCLLIYCKSLEGDANVCPEFKSDINLVKENATRIKIRVKSTFHIIKDNENERICLNTTIEERMKNNWKTIQEISNFFVDNYSALTQKDGSAISESKNNESVFLDGIIRKCITVDIDLYELYEKLRSGEYFVECTPNSVFSPVYSWAQIKRQEREEIITKLKYQVVTYNSEIVNLTGNLQRTKNKINKFQNLEKRDASQQTDKEESGDSIQDSGDCSSKAAYLLIQHDMENTIKFLMQKNSELKFASVKTQQEILKPLEVVSKPKYHHDTHNIIILQKRLGVLAAKLREILLPRIPDITKRTLSSKESQYKKYLAEKMLIKREIEDEMWKVTIDIKKLKTTSRSVWSDTSSFISQNVNFTAVAP